MSFTAEPVAHVESARTEPIDDDWSSVEQTIVLDDSFDESALDGIEDFSHLEVVYFLHRVDPAKIERGARHPRGNPDWPKVGIFAQRAKDRPNRIGLTTCRLVKREGRRLQVVDLDCIDGTPVLDIKPFVREFRPRGAYLQPTWVGKLMADYWRKRLIAEWPWPKDVDYERLKAAFSTLSKPLWVRGGHDFDELNDAEIQALIDRDPDGLTESDFAGYLENCLVGCVEDMRYLLPPMLRIWEEGLSQRQGIFRDSLLWKLHRFDLIDQYLSPEQGSAVKAFMLRALSASIARETTLFVRGHSASHVWVADFNAFGILSGRFVDLWNNVWKAERRGHAVAVLQYAATIAFDEDDNPIFQVAEPKRAGGPLPIWAVNWWGQDWKWRELNLEHLRRTLSADYLIERLEDIEGRFAGDEVARIARLLIDRVRDDPERVDVRCKLLPRAFEGPGRRPPERLMGWDALRGGTWGLSRIALRTCNHEEMFSFYSRMLDLRFRSKEVGGQTCLATAFGEVELLLVPMRKSSDFEGYPEHQLGFEVPDVDELLKLVPAHGGRLEGEVVRANGRVQACVRDPDGNTIELFGLVDA